MRDFGKYLEEETPNNYSYVDNWLEDNFGCLSRAKDPWGSKTSLAVHCPSEQLEDGEEEERVRVCREDEGGVEADPNMAAVVDYVRSETGSQNSQEYFSKLCNFYSSSQKTSLPKEVREKRPKTPKAHVKPNNKARPKPSVKPKSPSHCKEQVSCYILKSDGLVTRQILPRPPDTITLRLPSPPPSTKGQVPVDPSPSYFKHIFQYFKFNNSKQRKSSSTDQSEIINRKDSE
jgi:hypothetical protein